MIDDPQDGAAVAAPDDIVLSDDGMEIEVAADLATPEETDAEMDPEAAETSARPRRSVQDRIDEVTRARREAERERDYWREEAQRFQPPEPPEEEASPYAAQDDAAAIAHAVEGDWQARQTAFAQVQPDYGQVVDGDWACSPVMAEAIRTSETGAAVAYLLASHPDAARHIAGLHPLAQVREIGRLEAGVMHAMSQPAQHAQPKTVSDAPMPAPQIRGSAGRFRVDPATASFADFDKAYGN